MLAPCVSATIFSILSDFLLNQHRLKFRTGEKDTKFNLVIDTSVIHNNLCLA